jgi:hypothetical protein
MRCIDSDMSHRQYSRQTDVNFVKFDSVYCSKKARSTEADCFQVLLPKTKRPRGGGNFVFQGTIVGPIGAVGSPPHRQARMLGPVPAPAPRKPIGSRHIQSEVFSS